MMDRWMKSLNKLPEIDKQDAIQYNPTKKNNFFPIH